MVPTLLIGVSTGMTVAGCVACLVLGAGGYFAYEWVRKTARKREADDVVEKARLEGGQIVRDAQVQAKEEFIKLQEQFKAETNETRADLRELEKRLAKREDNLEAKLDTLNSKEKKLEQTERSLSDRNKNIQRKQEEIEKNMEEQRLQLLRISGLDSDSAKRLLLGQLEDEMAQECGQLIEKMLTEAKETAEEKSREIVVTALQRYAGSHTSNSTARTVAIPSDEMKGRVIGREGRNIRAFEKATGVDVIVDDTPGVVVVSAFNPVRNEVARIALETLIQDGRIHPSRIEEVVEETKKQVEKSIVEHGNRAAVEANVGKLHRKEIDLLGRLYYRTSYGQNVLNHSIEVAYLCQIMADELGMDAALARRCGLLHDIGKAVDHEVEGGHPQIGADICKRFGERSEVLNAIAGHHGDVPATSLYTPLVTAADAISASRPGGRRESLERYIKRLEQLESLATAFPGVKQAYAIQAGREIRVLVDADRIDDGTAMKTARDIAKKIEDEMTYPGEIKVTLLREVRAIEYAR